MLSWLIELLAPVLEAGLYIVVIVALVSRIGGVARDKIIPPKRGGGGGTGVVGHLAVAAIVGSFRLAGQATRAIVVGFFRYVAPALVGAVAWASTVVAGAAVRGSKPSKRRRLPQVSFEWPQRTSKALQPRYPADEFEDEWRQANSRGDFD